MGSFCRYCGRYVFDTPFCPYCGARQGYFAPPPPSYSSSPSITLGFERLSDGTLSVRSLVDKNATDIVIPEGVTVIEKNAFIETNIKSVTFPSTLKKIGGFAFYHCSNLISVKLNKGLEIIEEYAFTGCPISKIDIPDSVKQIEQNAFCNCPKLSDVNISSCNSALTYLGDAAFNTCTSLTSFTFPKSFGRLGSWTFAHCSSLKSLSYFCRLYNYQSGYRDFDDCDNLSIVIVCNEEIDYYTNLIKGDFPPKTTIIRRSY